jgi:hypothetical protein
VRSVLNSRFAIPARWLVIRAVAACTGFALLEWGFRCLHGGEILLGPCHVLLSTGIALAVSGLTERVTPWSAEHGWGKLARLLDASGRRLRHVVEKVKSTDTPDNQEPMTSAPVPVERSAQPAVEPQEKAFDLHRLMLERLPIGYAYVRREGSLGLHSDFLVLESNVRFEALFPGWPDAEMTATRRWPGLLDQHPEMFSALAAVTPDNPQLYVGSFASQGKSIEFRMTSLGGEDVLVTMRDVTDEMLYREEILRMHEQHDKVMLARDTRDFAMMLISEKFIRYAAEALYGPYDALEQLNSQEEVGGELSEAGHHALADLQMVIQYAIKFAGVTALDFTPKLVDMTRLYNDLAAKQRRQHPGNPLNAGALPYTTAAPDVARALLAELLDMANRYVVQAGSELTLGVRTESLESVYYLRVTHAAPREMLPSRAGGLTYPEGAPAMHLMVCRRLAAYHGGTLQLRETGVDEIEYTVTLGTPYLPETPPAAQN